MVLLWLPPLPFTPVPESVFGRVAWAHRNYNFEDGWAWLGDLPKYGCRKVVLESWRKGPVSQPNLACFRHFSMQNPN